MQKVKKGCVFKIKNLKYFEILNENINYRLR